MRIDGVDQVLESSDLHAGPTRQERRALTLLLFVLAVVHIIAIYRFIIYMDEFALFGRAVDAARGTSLTAAGHPGLGTLALVPFVAGCRDEITTAVAARWLWTAFAVLYVSGIWVLLRRVLDGGEHSWHPAAFGLALIILVPAVMVNSVMVRTDLPALAAGLWGGVLLLRSRSRPAWALGAGVLYGVGFLFTQKLIYVGALTGLLAAADLFLHGPVRLRRELIRIVLVAGSLALVLLLFHLIVSAWFAVPAMLPLKRGLGSFSFYREVAGYRVYARILKTQSPQLLMLGLLFVSTVAALRVRGTHDRELVVAWSVLALGLAVEMFHASRFSHFWLTLGLFPGVAGAFGYRSFRRRLHGRVGVLAQRAIWVLLGLTAFPFALLMVVNTQRIERASLAFIDRNFSRATAGFQNVRALFCREGPHPFPGYLGITIAARFHGTDGERNTTAFLEDFRAHQVSYIVRSPLLKDFPEPVQRFWRENYVPYYGPVVIAGRRLAGLAGTRRSFEIVASGEYRWWPSGSEGEDPGILIDGRRLAVGKTIRLAAGSHVATYERETTATLVLAVRDPPALLDERYAYSF